MFVQRDKDGAVKGVFTERQDYAKEEVAADHAEVVAFLADLDARMAPPAEGDLTTRLTALEAEVAALKGR